MKSKTLRCILCVLVFALLLPACADKEGEAPAGTHLPEYEKLTALIGKTKAEALAALSLQESDLVEFVPYDYELPMEVTYGGVKLQPGIAFVYENEDLLNTVTYRGVYEGNPEQAAKDMAAVAAELKNLMGTPNYETQTGVIAEMTEAELLKAIREEKRLSNDDGWDMTGQAPEHIKQYMEKLGSQSWWKETYGESKPRYVLILQISYIEETDTAYIQISYTVKPERKKQTNHEGYF